KRMGAYNALDDLLPGPAWGNPDGSPGEPGPAWDLSAAEPALPPRRPRLQPVPDPPRSRRRSRGEPNALDELLPGPGGTDGLDDLLPGPSAPPPRRAGLAPRGRSAGGRPLGVWNPLDGPPSAAPQQAPAPVPVRARVSFRLPADLVETARDAVAHLAGTADRTTLTALVERALRVELARLAITHNHGQPFAPRDP
ncbi:MAG: hypothetical protein ABW234_01085, partial [Actinomycetes bacterium]